MALRTLILQLFLSLAAVRAITVYNQQPLTQITTISQAQATASGSAASASPSTYKAYDTTVLQPPALPTELPATQFTVQLQNSASNVAGLSIMQSGAFLGFSIETSVITQVSPSSLHCWVQPTALSHDRQLFILLPMSSIVSCSFLRNATKAFRSSSPFTEARVAERLSILVWQVSVALRDVAPDLPHAYNLFLTAFFAMSFIQVPFLNLVSLITERAGRFHIRVGGNTQETARYVESTADGKMIEKQGIDPNNPTATPALIYTIELFYLLGNISSLVNAKWYLGIPLNDTSDLRLEIAEYGQAILGDSLIGLQVGNEPDLYLRHQHRPEGYNQQSYFDEFGQVIKAMQADSKIKRTDYLIGPSIAYADWTPESVWDTNFVPSYANNLAAVTVENYPSDNCASIYAGVGTPKVPQDEYYKYLSHDAPNSGKSLLQKFMASSTYIQSQGKPFIMFETNTASCGGFAGISNSFGAGLWALDYGLQAAYSNLSHALLHIGGQDVYYNPATPPPTGQSSYHKWTIGPLMYSILAVSEALGSSNQSQVLDLGMNNQNAYTPGYAIYEKGTLARVALFNYMTDPTGANAYTATIQVGGQGTANATPAQVKVKYLLASSVSDHFNITWAGQTFGGQFESDGRLMGNETIQTVTCDQTANTCAIKVPAPGFALVFMTDEALQESTPASTATFATTAYTKTQNTATVDSSVLATSNGHSGKSRQNGSTSKGSSNAAKAAGVVPSMAALVAMLAGVSVLVKAFRNSGL
ncbi:hypothetical protein NLI96_g3197 [Meripilus lineatus]|uniref:Beta-glucuronidase C-terminal domain-containing protein n=1 Tax=Meripilus lineatus TaxID=2056292 RepID=A0AAD5VCL0_9APHY|nr:hypothetical protein NLI96_g3197 [Physisporinus lineatus]